MLLIPDAGDHVELSGDDCHNKESDEGGPEGEAVLVKPAGVEPLQMVWGEPMEPANKGVVFTVTVAVAAELAQLLPSVTITE